MGKSWLVIRHEFLVMINRWSFRIFAAAVPVMAMIALVVIAVIANVRTEAPPPQEIVAGYVDMTRDANGDPIFTEHRQQGRTRFEPYRDVDSAVQALRDGDIQQLFVIPEDYLATGVVQEMRPQTSGIPSPQSFTPSATPLGRFLLGNAFADIGPERSDRILMPYHLATTELDPDGQPVTGGPDFRRFAFFMVVGILLVLSIFMTSGYLLQGLNDEKENRIMEVLLSSLRPGQLLFGKLIGLGAAGLFQMLIWTISGLVFVAVLGQIIEIPAEILLVPSLDAILIALAYFLLGYFFFAALMAALGAITTSQREANQLTSIIVLPAVAPLWFLQVLIENPDGTLARVLSIVPVTAPVVSLVRLGLDSMGPLDVFLSLAVLAGSVVLAILFTARLFRAYLLMYGQRPGLRQVFRTLRGA